MANQDPLLSTWSCSLRALFLRLWIFCRFYCMSVSSAIILSTSARLHLKRHKYETRGPFLRTTQVERPDHILSSFFSEVTKSSCSSDLLSWSQSLIPRVLPGVKETSVKLSVEWQVKWERLHDETLDRWAGRQMKTVVEHVWRKSSERTTGEDP